MGIRIVLVSCVKSKRSEAAAARDLYISQLFTEFRAYAEAVADEWFILSAEYGLLHPDQVIAPYNRTLNTMKKADRLAWADRVKQQLGQVLQPGSDVIILAGIRYREELIPFLREYGCSVSVPLEGLPFGKQLQRLKSLKEV